MGDAKTRKGTGSVIGSNMVITGDVTFQGQLHIKGTIKGSLRGDGADLSRSGRLEGEIILQELDCHGKIQGQVASGRLLMRNTADISGSIEARELDMASGAVVNGEMKISSDFKPGQSPKVDRSTKLQKYSDDDKAVAEEMTDEASMLESLFGTIKGGSQLVMVVSDRIDTRQKLRRDLQAQFDNLFLVVGIDDPTGSVLDLLVRIAKNLGVELSDHSNQAKILDELSAFLIASDSTGKAAVLLIDNGEKMFPATLEGIIQNLAVKGATGSALMQIVLFGRTELKKMVDLEAPDFQEREPDCIFEF